MDLSEEERAFAAIVRRLEDPEDRRDRRIIVIGCVTGVIGFLLTLVSFVVGWSLWVAALGLPALAVADLMGIVILKRWLVRQRYRRRFNEGRWERP